MNKIPSDICKEFQNDFFRVILACQAHTAAATQFRDSMQQPNNLSKINKREEKNKLRKIQTEMESKFIAKWGTLLDIFSETLKG